MKYLRSCILELFRLMNPVNSTFRTLNKDIGNFKKGEQFIIFNNAIMRDPDYFKNPHSFIPERWTNEMENEYRFISFNQGPQRCPGKELIIFICKCFIISYLQKYNIKDINISMKINKKNIPQVINPYKISF